MAPLSPERDGAGTKASGRAARRDALALTPPATTTDLVSGYFARAAWSFSVRMAIAVR